MRNFFLWSWTIMTVLSISGLSSNQLASQTPWMGYQPNHQNNIVIDPDVTGGDAELAAQTGPYPVHAGYPVSLNSWTEKSATVIADINNDGHNEFLVATYNSGTPNPGKIHAVSASGVSLPGFPVNTGGHVRGRIALADLDGDGTLEIAAGADSFSKGVGAQVGVWRSDGSLMPGWPQQTACFRPNQADQAGQYCTVASVAISDLDGDGKPEVIAATDNRDVTTANSVLFVPNMYVWHSNGQTMSGEWPLDDSHNTAVLGPIAIGDLDNNGTPDIAAGRDYNRLFSYDYQGSHLPNWPVYVWYPYDRNNWNDDQIEFARSAVTLADLDGDGVLEYIVNGLRRHMKDAYYYNTDLLIYTPNGTRWRNWEESASGVDFPKEVSDISFRMIESPAIGDMNGDNRPDIVVATEDGWVRAYTAEKQLLWQTNYTGGKLLFATETVIADVDGDGKNEVVFGTSDPTYGSVGPVGLWILENDGSLKAGMPMTVDGPGISGTPAIGDLDNDGNIEIAATTVTGKLYVWDAPGAVNPGRMPWPMARQNLGRTGLYTAAVTDMSASRFWPSKQNASQGDTIRFTIRLVNSGAGISEQLSVSNVIPDGLTYVPGSLKATTGQVNDTQSPRLSWIGIMGDLRQLEIQYDVTVTRANSAGITNVALVNAGSAGQLSLRSQLIINGKRIFLSFTRR